jgi:hypothetical protein
MTIVIDNFSLGVEDWISVANLNYFAVDVVDSTYGISSPDTYFVHDGQVVSTTHSGITGGYTCYYTPSGVYSDGTIDLTIHAENTVSGVEEQTFHLLYGYNVEFEELIDWGPKTSVITTVAVTNKVFCPNIKAESFYFETADLWSTDLKATIYPVGYVDLESVIFPQSTAFFYSRTFTVSISGVRDFNSNEMPVYTFSFTIEDPPN